MARLKKVDTDKRKAEARRLYISGKDMATIAMATNTGRDTIANWATEGNWNESRDAQALSIEEVNNIIFDTIAQIKEGKVPKTSPDQLAKLVSAFEKLNDKQKIFRYGKLAFNTLIDKILEDIAAEKSKTKREQYIAFFRRIHSIMDELMENWFNKIENK